MKKIISLLLSFCIAASCCAGFTVNAFAADKYFDKETIDYYKNLGLQGITLNVYNWGEYISAGDEDSMDVIGEFERLTGAKVNYTQFDSNEDMYSKLSGGGVSYDVIVPSDYMVDRLVDEDMLCELDYSNIPNFKNVRSDCKNLYFDPQQKYSVCYNTGTTVLIYNKKLVKETPDSWSVLWDEQYRGKVLMFNNPRDAFAIAQFMLGQNINTTDEQDWADAAELLAQQKDKVKPVYVMDEVFNLMESGEYAFATYYAGDFVLMNENNPNLGFCFPKEGVNAFYDAFCVPKCTKNKKGAEAFINFMMEPEVALQNQEFIYYASANDKEKNNTDSSLYGNEAVYPKRQPKSQPFKNLPQNILELENSLWTQIKSDKLSTENKSKEKQIYIESAAVGGVVVICVAVSIVKKRKKKKEQDLSDLYE